jgi:glutathione-regulated potassium-efflux system ancillary protein KefC
MDLHWIGVAFLLGLGARRLGQPPLLGFLAAGFGLELIGLRPDESLRELAHVGILLLLFTIGLKLDLRSLTRAYVYGSALFHMALVTALGGGALLLAAAIGVELALPGALTVAFALSFSSTVFAVKMLEERDDMCAMYGRVAIGILIVQDVVAVAFLAASKGEWPSPWALALLGLIPLRRVSHRALGWCGHGELLILAGLAAALGGAALFELVGLKADLGALATGILLGGHDKSRELAKSLLGLKEVFLVGFFVTLGLTGLPTLEMLGIALVLTLLLPLKGLLFFGVLIGLRLRARTALLASLGLTSYSEFGLIVATVAVAGGWLANEWLVTLAIATGLSFLLGSTVNGLAFEIYRRLRPRLRRWERSERVEEERPVDVGAARVLVFGMGRVGASAYDEIRAIFGGDVVGFDIDEGVVARNREAGRTVHRASATDADFWEQLHVDRDRVEVVLLAMSSHEENRVAVRQLRAEGFRGTLAATARFTDEIEALTKEGADSVFHVLQAAGPGFVAHALEAADLSDGRPSRVPRAG